MSRPNSNDSGVEDAATTAQRLMQYVVHIRRGDGSPIGDEESAANGAGQDGKGRREREELELLLEQELLADHRHLQMQAKEVEHQQHRQPRQQQQQQPRKQHCQHCHLCRCMVACQQRRHRRVGSWWALLKDQHCSV